MKKKLIKTIIITLLLALLIFKIFPIEKETHKFDINKTRYIESTNDIMAYELKPNYSGRDNSIITNKDGLMDYEYEIEKPENITRIVIIGDSVAEGYGVPFNYTFSKVLEKRLNAHSNKYEVINFAIYTYSTIQELEILKEKGLKYKPDIVVIAYVLNDPIRFGYVWEGLNKNSNFKYEDAVLDAANANFICRAKLFSKKITSNWKFLKQKDQLSNLNNNNNIFKFYERIHKDSCSWETVTYSFSEISELSKEEDFEVILTIIPIMRPSFHNYRLENVHKQVKEEGEKNNFEVIDILEPYRDYTRNLLITLDDHLHPNDEGHEIIAQKLYEQIIN